MNATTGPGEARWVQLRRRAGGAVIHSLLRSLSRVARAHPEARALARASRVIANVPYDGSGKRERRLDIYIPRAPADGPRPAVLYIHGGGFRILSKDTHWMMARILAARGYVVFTLDYRLAPAHPYPAALEDVSLAVRWLAAHAEAHGADLGRLAIAGESAGGNLSTAVAISTCFPRPEPAARAILETGITPACVLPACPILQISDHERFGRVDGSIPTWQLDRIATVCREALGAAPRLDDGTYGLADPIVILEGDAEPIRPLPPFFVGVGDADPIREDSYRLVRALQRRGVACGDGTYKGTHAFHAAWFTGPGRAMWRDQLAFLAEHCGAREGAPAEG